MKNLKKVLALVLAMVMSLSMFAGAVAFDDVVIGSDYSAAISMLSDLNVISGDGKGNYNPNGTITRAEACVLIANMMNGGKADTARFAGGSNFVDVAKSFWGESAIAFCVQNGITYGVGANKFAPNREITDAEFVAMLTRAMGYDTAANPLSFPYGNYTAAVNNGLLANIPYAEGSDCTRGEAAQMIYDALFADYARLTANLNVVHGADDHDTNTLINDVFGLTMASNETKTKACTQHKWVIVAEDCTDEDIILAAPVADKTNEIIGDAVEFECTADVSALIGYEVALWGKGQHADVDVIKAVEVFEGQATYEYNPTMADSKDNDKLAECDDLKVADEAALNVKNGNSYTLIDWDNDGDEDFTITTARYYADVTALTSKKVVLDVVGHETYTLDLAGNDTKKFDCEFTNEHDYVVELDEAVEEGDVVEITVDDAYKSTVTISISKVESVEKEFTNWKSNGKRFFDETDELTDAAAAVCSSKYTVAGLKKAQQDDSFDIWFDANGYVIKMADPAAAESEYLMVLGVADGKYVGVASKNTKAAMTVMYTDGTTAEIDVAYDAEIAQYDTDKYEFSNESAIVGGVFKYELNADGDVSKMALVERTKTSYAYDADYETIQWYSNHSSYLTGDDFIFVVDKAYVDYDATSHGDVYTVDTDKVVVLSLDELKDIDATGDNAFAVAAEGAYDGDAIAYTPEYDKNQDATEDYVDGAMFVVDDLDAYLDAKSTKVGLITEIDYNGKKDVYTFTMYLDGAAEADYVSVKVKEDETAEKIADATDAAIIESIATDAKDLKDFGNGLYAAVTFNKADQITNVELLDNADYTVVRGIVTETASKSFRIMDATAVSDKKIESIDEYKDAYTAQIKYADDMFVYVDAEIPGLTAGKAVNGNEIFHDDSELSVGSKSDIVASKFNITNKTDIYNVVDVIYKVVDGDKVAVGVVAFAEVEADDYTPAVEYKLYVQSIDTATGNAVAYVGKTTTAIDGTKTTVRVDIDDVADDKWAATLTYSVPDTSLSENGGKAYTTFDIVILDIDDIDNNQKYEATIDIDALNAKFTDVSDWTLEKVTVTLDAFGGLTAVYSNF